MTSYTLMRDGLEQLCQQALDIATDSSPKESAPDGFEWRAIVKVNEDDSLTMSVRWVAEQVEEEDEEAGVDDEVNGGKAEA